MVMELMTNNLINLPSLTAFAEQHDQKRMPQTQCETKHKTPEAVPFTCRVLAARLRVYQHGSGAGLLAPELAPGFSPGPSSNLKTDVRSRVTGQGATQNPAQSKGGHPGRLPLAAQSLSEP